MRPELRNASCDFLAPAEYMVRPPQRPGYVFLLDVSSHAVQSGFLKASCELLAETLSQLPGEDRTVGSIITYDSQIHYYNLKACLHV